MQRENASSPKTRDEYLAGDSWPVAPILDEKACILAAESSL
jgi:hypothetical protein